MLAQERLYGGDNLRREWSAVSRDMLAHVFGQDTINESLVPDIATRGFFSQLFQHIGIQPDRDELTCLPADRRPADTTHRAQLLVRGFSDI